MFVNLFKIFGVVGRVDHHRLVYFFGRCMAVEILADACLGLGVHDRMNLHQVVVLEARVNDCQVFAHLILVRLAHARVNDRIERLERVLHVACGREQVERLRFKTTENGGRVMLLLGVRNVVEVFDVRTRAV